MNGKSVLLPANLMHYINYINKAIKCMSQKLCKTKMQWERLLIHIWDIKPHFMVKGFKARLTQKADIIV